MNAVPRPSRRRRLVFVALAIGCALATPAIAFEIWVRATKPWFTPESLRREALRYRSVVGPRHALEGGQVYRFDGREMGRINSRGYRGAEFPADKPAGEIRIVFVGGSMVFDQFAADGADWPTRVGTLLREAGRTNVRTINAGVPGHASLDSLARLQTEIWMWRPDFVAICNAWNDMKYFPLVSPERPLLRLYRPFDTDDDPRLRYANPLDRLLCLSQVYVKVRTKWYDYRLDAGPEGARRREGEGGAATAAAGGGRETGLAQYRLVLATFADAARNAGAEPILVAQPTLAAPGNEAATRDRIRYEYVGMDHAGLVEAFDACRAIALDVAREKRAEAIDLHAELSGREELFADHVHPNAEGSEAIARIVAERIGARLAAEAGESATATP